MRLRFQQHRTPLPDSRTSLSKQSNTVLPFCIVSLSKTCYFIMPPVFLVKTIDHTLGVFSNSTVQRGARGSVVLFVPPTPRTRVRFRPVARGFFTLLYGLTCVIMSRIERPDDRTGDNVNYTYDLNLLINNLDIDKESKTVEYSKSNFC